MKKIHILEESKLLLEAIYNTAGTDHPSYYDEKTDTWYEANWDSDYGFPFGFWPVNDGGQMEFSVGDEGTTHANACGKAARIYCNEILNEQVSEDISAITDKIYDLKSDIAEYGYVYNEASHTYVDAEGDEVIDLYNEADDLVSELSFMRDYDYVYELLTQAIVYGNEIDEEQLERNIIDRLINDNNFTDRDGIDLALQDVGTNFQYYFESGNSEGRIWPEREMIGFYETEQPDPQHLLYILQLLSNNSEVGVDYDDMLNYYMVFEDWRNNGTVTCCTIADYVDGNYGPESYEEDEDEFEDDEPTQYARDGKTVFVPHLANQDQKREFFKDFRNTRDQAVYAPREKGAGSLAAYHAMRYPYGESKDKIGKIVTEVINNMIKGETK